MLHKLGIKQLVKVEMNMKINIIQMNGEELWFCKLLSDLRSYLVIYKSASGDLARTCYTDNSPPVNRQPFKDFSLYLDLTGQKTAS